MRNFYTAEACALEPKVLVKSFADVGLWPFNPEKFLENCHKFSPVDPHSTETNTLTNLARAIEKFMGEEMKRTTQMLKELKCVRVVSPEKVQKRKRQDQEQVLSAVHDHRKRSTSTKANKRHTASEPPRKRGRPAKSSSKK